MSSAQATNGHPPTAVTKPKATRTGATAGTAASSAPSIQISRLEQETMRVPIIGTTPLIVHAFSEKAKRTMLDAMQGTKSPKEPKDPTAEYEAAFYWYDKERRIPGFPANGFKLATVDASRFYGKDVTKVALRQFIFIFGEDHSMMARINGDAEMRQDVVRVGQGGTDLRYRPEFKEWSTTLEVIYFKSVLTRDSVLSLVDAGGMGVGIGEWRPARDGINGTYQVDPDRPVEIIS
jgi:hypothetical protein